MSQKDKEFPHLPLPLKTNGHARLYGGGKPPEQEKLNKENRQAHSQNLTRSARNIVEAWTGRRLSRDLERLPTLPKGVPLLLQVEPDSDLEFLRSSFKFEVVSEQEDGFVIVSSEDLDLTAFLHKVEDFTKEKWGTGTTAKIYNLHDDPQRLDRILSDSLRDKWPTISDDKIYVFDIGVECLGTISFSELDDRKKEETEEQYQARRLRWETRRKEAHEAWDEIKIKREEEIENFVNAYKGEILDVVDNVKLGPADLPDSFTVRIRMSGKGMRDIILNHPYIFEVVEPDEFAYHNPLTITPVTETLDFKIFPPNEAAPRVCVIDSGIQEEHRLLRLAIDSKLSWCFIPGQSPTDVADYVRDGGHGTRVAGAVLYPNGIPSNGSYQLPCYIQNARVLDENNHLRDALFPPLLLNAILNRFHSSARPTRIFNHSIAGALPCRTSHMSAWAAEIDKLSYDKDILIIQSAGNLRDAFHGPIRLGIIEHLKAGRNYPNYLLEKASRIPNPSQSFQALTVGSIALDAFHGSDWKSFGGKDQPSAFSTTGLGIWGTIKPEVVEYGGDFAYDTGSPPNIITPPEVCPDLVRSTYNSPGPEHARDDIGTSFAAPKVANIASTLEQLFPEQPCLLYRALIANAARWPQWTEDSTNPLNVLRHIGFGIPTLERATTNSPHRATLISTGELQVKAGEAHIYRIPVPEEMRSQGAEYDIRIDVTLSYAAKPRRTRRNPRNYLSTWVDWRSSKIGESFESFKNRMLKESIKRDDDGEDQIPWLLRERKDWGGIEGVKRNVGTLQKDWTILKSYELPIDFCIAVVGHRGWDKDPGAFAKYSLVVSFEAVNEDLEIYEMIRVAVEIPKIEAEIEVETTQ